MGRYLLALDEGTTSARAILFNEKAEPVAVTQKEFSLYYPNPGWVEQDAEEIYAVQREMMLSCVKKAGISPSEIAGIGITNQRETTILWDKRTGKPIYHAIVWQCVRTAEQAEKLKREGYSDLIRSKTGLLPDAYFSATKIQWILENVPSAKRLADEGNLLFGTVDCWLLWKLTGGKVHATDRTNASRTMLYNIVEDKWDEELLSLLNIPFGILPSVQASSSLYGYTEIDGVSIPICGIAGDQQSALFGQGCFSTGECKNTYGTGCFLLCNVGKRFVRSENGLVTTLTATREGEPLQYALEGSVFIGGAVIQWLRDELDFIKSSSESEDLAETVADTDGVYFVPAFGGLGAPYWDRSAKGVIIGLTRGTNKAHITKAALEAIAYQSNDLILSMEKDMGKKIRKLKVDGGASRNRMLMQFQADISDLKLICASDSEATARGASFLAGLSCGVFQSTEDIRKLLGVGKTYSCGMNQKEREERLSGWQKAVRCSRTME